MGQPKKQRRRYSRPKHPWKVARFQEEGDLKLKYGLKNNKEVWKVKAEVSRLRELARKLLATPNEKEEADILRKLKAIGLIGKEAKLEDILKIAVDDVMGRRLQTKVYEKGLATSIKQARQEIIHGHIAIKGGRMTVPGHLLTLEESENITFYGGSPLADPEHPVRKVEKKASTDKVEKKASAERPNARGRGQPRWGGRRERQGAGGSYAKRTGGSYAKRTGGSYAKRAYHGEKKGQGESKGR
jgi:small subunit ribosomal protein S4